MRVFKVSELNHAFFGKTIFHRAELMVQDGEHIGLVGPNGAGKSTFFKLLLGEVIPDAWQSELRDGLKIGYLDQAADLQAACTVYDYLRSVYDALFALDAQVNELYDAVATLPEDRQMEAIERAQTLSEQLNERGH